MNEYHITITADLLNEVINIECPEIQYVSQAMLQKRNLLKVLAGPMGSIHAEIVGRLEADELAAKEARKEG